MRALADSIRDLHMVRLVEEPFNKQVMDGARDRVEADLREAHERIEKLERLHEAARVHAYNCEHPMDLDEALAALEDTHE